MGWMIFGAALAAGYPVSQLWADDGNAGGAAVYLREGLGARALGMGNAATAQSQDSTGAYWNPAGLTQLKGPSGSFQTSILGMGRSWNFFNYAQSFDLGDSARMAAAFSWIGFSAGADIEGRVDNRPDPDRTFSDGENALVFSGAFGLGNNWSVGTNIKVLMHQLDTSNASGPGLDLAFWQAPSDQIQWGLVVQDLYSVLNWSDTYNDRVPTMVRLGGSMTFLEKALTVSADADLLYSQTNALNNQFSLHGGAEYKFWESLAIRAGWDQDRWTAGAGCDILFGGAVELLLDYAAAGERLPGAGLTHLISMAFNVRM
jgi:hypothetical protein